MIKMKNIFTWGILALFICAIVFCCPLIANASQNNTNSEKKSLSIEGCLYRPLIAPGQNTGDLVFYDSNDNVLPKSGGDNYTLKDLVNATQFSGNEKFYAIRESIETWNEAFNPDDKYLEFDTYVDTYKGKNMLNGDYCESLWNACKKGFNKSFYGVSFEDLCTTYNMCKFPPSKNGEESCTQNSGTNVEYYFWLSSISSLTYHKDKWGRCMGLDKKRESVSNNKYDIVVDSAPRSWHLSVLFSRAFNGSTSGFVYNLKDMPQDKATVEFVDTEGKIIASTLNNVKTGFMLDLPRDIKGKLHAFYKHDGFTEEVFSDEFVVNSDNTFSLKMKYQNSKDVSGRAILIDPTQRPSRVCEGNIDFVTNDGKVYANTFKSDYGEFCINLPKGLTGKLHLHGVDGSYLFEGYSDEFTVDDNTPFMTVNSVYI